MIRTFLRLVLLSTLTAWAGAAPARAACPGRADVPMVRYDGVRPGVEVMVNGAGPYLFLIDTGAAGQMRADAAFVARAGLPLSGEAAISDGSGAREPVVRNAAIATLTLGGLVFRGLSGPSREYNGPQAQRRIDGILGFDLFEGCLLTLDYARGRVVVGPGTLPRRDPNVLPFDRSSGSPGVTMALGRIRVHADLDSGSGQGFSLPASLAARLTLAAPPRITGYGQSASNRFPIRRAPIRETIRVGRVTWPAPEVELTETFDFANIGSQVLAGLVVTFDLDRHLLRLVRPGR